MINEIIMGDIFGFNYHEFSLVDIDSYIHLGA